MTGRCTGKPMIDPDDLPPPTISLKEARARIPRLNLLHRQLIREQRAALAARKPHNRFTSYYLRQLVEYGDQLGQPGQMVFDFGENP